MGQSRANYRRVKIHRSYTIEEVARLFGNHKNTVRAWVKSGLPTCDRKRPTLILGRELAAFLEHRRKSRKQPCRPGEVYCVRCRAPKAPAGNMVEYKPVTAKVGNVTAICPGCDSIMNQRVGLTKLRAFQGKMEVTFSQGLPRVIESCEPTVNSDLK